MIRGAFIFAVVGLMLTVPGRVAEAAESKPAPLTLKLSGYVGRAESDVIVRMRVEPDERARQLLIEWTGDDLSGGSHVIALEGARAAVSHQYSIKRLPAGSYVVSATLRFNDGSETRKQVNVIMVGADGVPSAERGLGERGPSASR
jgi:hypothetical protein